MYSACSLYDVFVAICGFVAGVMERAQRCRAVKYDVPEMMLVLSKGQKLKLWEIEICRPVHNVLISLLTAASRLHRYPQATKDDGR